MQKIRKNEDVDLMDLQSLGVFGELSKLQGAKYYLRLLKYGKAGNKNLIRRKLRIKGFGIGE